MTQSNTLKEESTNKIHNKIHNKISQ